MERSRTAESDRASRRRGLRLLVDVLLRRRRWLWAAAAASLLWTAARLTIPLLVAEAVDEGVIKEDVGVAVRYSVVIVVLGLFQAVGSGFRRYGAFWLAYRTETDLRSRLFAHLQRMHFAFHDASQTGELMSRANSDLLQVNQAIAMLPMSTAAVITFVGVAVIMLVKSWQLTLLTLAALPLLNLATARFSQRIGPVSLRLQEELADLSSVVEETVAGVRAVKGFGAEQVQADLLAGSNQRVLGAALVSSRLRAGFLPLIDLIPNIAYIAVLWYGGQLVLDGRLAVGDLVAFSLYIGILVQPMRIVGYLIAQAARAIAAGSRIYETLELEPQIVDPEHPVALPEGGGEVTFEGVGFGYAQGQPVFAGLDLAIPAGQSVAVVGTTGSGKTTLARLIPRLYDIDAGSIRIDGLDVGDLALVDLRRAVGIVFEDTFLFSGSVTDNIAFAAPHATPEEVRRAAEVSGALDFIDELPAGFDTEIGEHGFSLSGGQRQRIAIARAVITDPRVLILDDATSAVDPSKEHEIRGLLGQVMRGRTTIIVAHRAATIALADRVVVVGEGRIVADGTHDELWATSKAYRDVLDRTERGPAGADAPAPMPSVPAR